MKDVKYHTVYIGHIPECAEYICHSDFFSLDAVICEKGRTSDEMLTFTLVRDVPLNRVTNKSDLLETMRRYDEETIFVMHGFGMRIPMENLVGYRVFNIHDSLLPNYKGAPPTYWATIHNEKRMGITLFSITERFDDGDIIAQESFPYYYWENENDLQEKCISSVPKLLSKLSDYLTDGKILMKNSPGDYYPKVSKEDVFIDVTADSPQMIFQKVRAEAAFGGAKIELNGDQYGVKSILFSEGEMNAPFLITDHEMRVQLPNGLIMISTEYEKLSIPFAFRGKNSEGNSK